MRNEFVTYAMTDPETGMVYTFEARFHDKDVEIDVVHEGVLKANVMVEVYNGKCQVVIADQQRMEETGGDDPQLVTLFEEKTSGDNRPSGVETSRSHFRT